MQPDVSDAELLAMVCSGGYPGRVVRPPSWAGGVSCLTGLSEAELMAQLGIGRHAARRLLWAFALHRRVLASRIPERPCAESPVDVAKLMRPLLEIDHERMWCLPLDSSKNVIGSPIELARGDVDWVDVSYRRICSVAVRAGASAIVLVHNHVVWDLTASGCDIALTRSVIEAGRSIGITLLDHVICNRSGCWNSLRQKRPDLWAEHAAPGRARPAAAANLLD
jgi:DNA repair protein RadC